MNGELIDTLLGHTDEAISVRMSKNNRYIISGGYDK